MSVQQVECDGDVVRYHRQGKGSTVLLIHGFPLDHTMWEAQFAGLRERFDLIALDLPGCGGSELGSSKWSIGRLANRCHAFLNRLEITTPVAIVGLSLGGYIAFEYCRQYRRNLSKLVLCNTRPTADHEATRRGRLKMASLVMREGTEATIQAMRTKLFSSETLESRPQDVSRLWDVMRSTEPSTIAALQKAMASREDVSAQLSEFDLPTLVIGGTDDEITPAEQMRSWAALLPDAQWHEIAKAGHLSPWEQPEIVNRLLADFLTS